MKTLLIVSGGDSPGINMALAAFVRLAETNGDTVVGAQGSFPGLLDGNIVPLTSAILMPWATQAGAYLLSSREPVLKNNEAQESILKVLSAHQVDNVVLFGGNGTLNYVLPLLVEWSIACIGLPTTIDNDVPGTERTLGFDSACNFAYQAIDGIMATAHALPGRIFMVETLGGETGYLALDIALGSRADGVLLPEYTYPDDWLANRLRNTVQHQGYALLVLSEGVKDSRILAESIAQQTAYRVRDVRLGHAQRGGKPTHLDRTLAAQMARVAHDALHSGVTKGVVLVRGGRTTLHLGTLNNFPLSPPDRQIYESINGLDHEHSRD